MNTSTAYYETFTILRQKKPTITEEVQTKAALAISAQKIFLLLAARQLEHISAGIFIYLRATAVTAGGLIWEKI
ncbi:MAG: hypothetical protein SCH71_02425 [Desulfobulbaceae bacterium]|nr:hypothetical protein [Desulfobulbaceae bacterium]